MQFETNFFLFLFLHLYYPLSAPFTKRFFLLLERVKLIHDQLPKSHTHLQNIAQLADCKAIVASTAVSPGFLPLSSGPSSAKYSFASLKRDNLWHLQNKIGSFGYCPSNLLPSLAACVCVRVCMCA